MSISSLSSLSSGGGAADRLTPSVEALVPARLRIVRAPAALTRAALPEPVVEAIAPGLRALGCRYEPRRIVRSLGREKVEFEFGQVQGGSDLRRALLYIEDAILREFDRANKIVLDELRETLQGDTEGAPFEALYVFHDAHPNGAYKNLMSGEWRDRYGIVSKFIPITDVSGDFADWDLDDQVQYLRRELDLDARVAARRPGGPAPEARKHITKISYLEIGDLSRLIATLPEFIDARGRSVLLRSVGLDHLTLQMDLSGPPLIVCRDLILALLGSGEAPGMRRLLDYVETLGELPTDDREKVAALLAGYAFD